MTSETLLEPDCDEVDSTTAPSRRMVTLVDETQCDLADLTEAELLQLQTEQEPAWATQIALSTKGSPHRAAIVRQAYESVCAILDEASSRQCEGQSLSMGMDQRYTHLVLNLLKHQQASGIDGGLFELGFGSGIMLAAAANQGFRVGGLEVVEPLLNDAKRKLADEHHDHLWLGDFCATDFGDQSGSFSVVYWNDVLEHIPCDELSDYLNKINSLLKPGGKLVTITPNWHMRPSDVTVLNHPPRTTASGFHLKEYTLREVRAILKAAGFTDVRTPNYISRTKIYHSNRFDLTPLKAAFEPLLECLPFGMAVQVCRRFGLNCTIATKSSQASQLSRHDHPAS